MERSFSSCWSWDCIVLILVHEQNSVRVIQDYQGFKPRPPTSKEGVCVCVGGGGGSYELQTTSVHTKMGKNLQTQSETLLILEHRSCKISAVTMFTC